MENSLLDDTFEVRSDGITVNYLTFRHIERKHLHARLICQASNNNLVAPETRVAVLDINCKYKLLDVVILLFPIFDISNMNLIQIIKNFGIPYFVGSRSFLG